MSLAHYTNADILHGEEDIQRLKRNLEKMGTSGARAQAKPKARAQKTHSWQLEKRSLTGSDVNGHQSNKTVYFHPRHQVTEKLDVTQKELESLKSRFQKLESVCVELKQTISKQTQDMKREKEISAKEEEIKTLKKKALKSTSKAAKKRTSREKKWKSTTPLTWWMHEE